jgi:alanine racemase
LTKWSWSTNKSVANELNNWIELDSQAYRANLRFFRRHLNPEVVLSLVVKSNAYGHGLAEIVTLASAEGVDEYCVHTLAEAEAVRGVNQQANVLILGYLHPREWEAALLREFDIAVFADDFPPLLAALADGLKRRAKLHLKLETGTNRYGITNDAMLQLAAKIAQYPQLTIRGLYTHYADIEDTTDHSFAEKQLGLFRAASKELLRQGHKINRHHTACSAAALLFPQTHMQMVRLGISQYGLWPSRETYLSYLHQKPGTDEQLLQPVLTWKTRVSQVKDVSKGEYIGYGSTYRVSRDSRIAVLPIGYFDGYPRSLSNRAHVLINGQRAAVRGRVCMNLLMVDITDIDDVKTNAEVVLLGRQGDEEVSAGQIAAWAETIHYEIIARLNPLIPRIIS